MSYPVAFIDFCKVIEPKLTSLRKNILYILWVAKKPLKAYEILNILMQTQKNAKPPTIYRVLDYFIDQSLVHKIESIQCYTLCHDPEKQYPSELLMVCSQCQQVLEVYDRTISELIIQISEQHQFQLGQDTIELKGLCHLCLATA